nr:MAG TPA: hypothetical protein [Bacteriophage sp.]
MLKSVIPLLLQGRDPMNKNQLKRKTLFRFFLS